MTDQRIQANEREIAELREQNTSLQNQLNSLWQHERWLTNVVARLSQRIGVIEDAADIKQPPQRNTETCYLDEAQRRVG